MKKHAKRWLTWRRILVIMLLLMIILPIAAFVRMSSTQPLVVDAGTLDAASSAEARQLASALRNQILAPSDFEEFSATEQGINGLLRLANRSFPRIAGLATVSPWGVEVLMSVHVPENPFGDYVNLRVGVVPSDHGLEFSHSSVGNVQFSGNTTLRLSRWALNQILTENLGTEFIDDVEAVAINGSEVSVKFRPIGDLEARLDRFKDRFNAVRDDLGLLGDPAVVRQYHSRICEFDSLNANGRPVSLGWYLATAFELASDRVVAGNDAVAESRAAILALGIMLGNRNIETLVGSVRSDGAESCRQNPDYVFLANRHDLRLHFVISAVLETISNSDMSGAAGEFKELIDTEEGGSGFSFVDLAADMAGVKLANELLRNAESAKRTLAALTETHDERMFFPELVALPENLSQSEFESRYGGLDDPRYQAVVAEIERRLAVLPLYRD